MARVCVRHPFQHSENLCGHCGLEFCRDCLVFPKGRKKAPLCVSCALAKSGVRAAAAIQPAMPRRELKRRLKERQAELAALARLEREPDPIPPIANPFSPGWAVNDDPPPLDDEELAPAAAPPPPPPPAPVEPAPPPPPPRRHEPVFADAAPTLADLLPSVGAAAPRAEPEPQVADLARLPVEEPPVESPERRRGLPLLRRREEPEDDGREASEMIAWLDEVFAPRDQV